MNGSLMEKLCTIGLAALVVGAFACSTAAPPKTECPGCHSRVDQACPRDARCLQCDACTARCGGCGLEVKALEMCPKCRKKCRTCDPCTAKAPGRGREVALSVLCPTCGKGSK